MTASLRIALCQLECHPAIFASHLNYLTEPFVPNPGQPSLSVLSMRGLDVAALESTCRDQYLAWHEARVAAVLHFLRTLDPPPDVVFFPETSLPLETLQSVAEWSALTGATVFAGSHTPRQSHKSLPRYLALGVAKETVQRLFRYGSTNTLPIIQRGEVTLIPKRLYSPYERTIVSEPSRELPLVRPYELRPGTLRILPLICSEALQIHSVRESYDLVGIVANDARPENFKKYIDLQTSNSRPVAFCNDGAGGGTFVHSIVDRRTPNWMLDALPSGLPAGDAVLVVDLDLGVTAIEVGTAVPRQALRLVSLASVVAGQSPPAATASALERISAMPEADARAQGLAALLASPDTATDALQRLRLEHLHRLEIDGYPSDDWWKALGRDCVVPTRPSLRQLEATLASICFSELTKCLSSPLAQRGDTPGALVAYLGECQRRATSAPVGSAGDLAALAESKTAILDRDSESREVHAFLDDGSLGLLEISGLQQIGKSSVLTKALAESGVRRVLRIQLTDTSSAEYIVQTVFQAATGSAAVTGHDPVELIRSEAISEILKTVQVLVIERAHLLLNHGTWRDELVPKVLEALVETAGQAHCKIVLETRRQLPLSLVSPSIRKPLRVYGLDRLRTTYGVSLFDAQLRRVGLAPSVLGSEDKAFIVRKLGGHPVAIALAADTAFEGGALSLMQGLKTHQGFFLNFVARLARALELSDQDKILLQMLSLARVGVPREALLQAAGFPAGEQLRDLISIGAVEVTPDGLLEIAGVLREYFDADSLSVEQRNAFHKAAAEAYTALASERHEGLAAAIEAEFHAGVIGVAVPDATTTRLVDGALASAFRLFNAGDHDKAATIVQRLLDGRRTIDILRLAAKVEAHRNNFDVALQHARAAFSRNPRDTDLLADLAKIALNQYRDDVAEEMISIARAAGVEAVAILVVEGRMRLRRADFSGAERTFRRAIELTTSNAWPYYFLGVSYMQSGRLDDAIEVLEAGERFYYDSQSRSRRALMAIRTKLAVSHLLLGRHDLAGPIIDGLVKEDPDNPEVLRAQGALIIVREGIQHTAKALELLTKSRVKSRRDRAQLHLFAGTFFLGIDDRHGAAEEFRRGLDADNGNVLLMMKLARSLFDLAAAAWRQGDASHGAYLDECRSVTRRILRFDRDNSEGVALMEDVARIFKVDI